MDKKENCTIEFTDGAINDRDASFVGTIKVYPGPKTKGITAAEQRRLDALEARNNKQQCENRLSGWMCTRIKGHKGNHVAHGAHVCAVWPNEEEGEK